MFKVEDKTVPTTGTIFVATLSLWSGLVMRHKFLVEIGFHCFCFIKNLMFWIYILHTLQAACSKCAGHHGFLLHLTEVPEKKGS